MTDLKNDTEISTRLRDIRDSHIRLTSCEHVCYRLMLIISDEDNYSSFSEFEVEDIKSFMRKINEIDIGSVNYIIDKYSDGMDDKKLGLN